MDPCFCELAAPMEIPHTVVDTRFVDGKDATKNYPGYYVEVRDENTIYHVTTPHNGCILSSLAVARLPIYKENYDPEAMPTYRNNVVFDFARNKMFVFDFNKNYRVINMTEGR